MASDSRVLPFHLTDSRKAAPSSGDQLREWVELAKFLTNKQIDGNQFPERWQLAYRQNIDGIMSFYCAPTGGAA